MKTNGKYIEKILSIIFTSIFSIILFVFFGYKYPIAHVSKKIDLAADVQSKLDKSTGEIYCTYCMDEQEWRIIGKDGVLFNSYMTEPEEICVHECTPRFIVPDLDKNIFIFEGKYSKEIKDGYIKRKYKVFDSEEWYIKYPIKTIEYRKNGFPLFEILILEESK